MPGHRDAVAGPAQRGGQVPRHVGGAAAAAAVAARGRAARPPARHRGHRAGQPPAAPRQLTPLAFQTYRLQRTTPLAFQSVVVSYIQYNRYIECIYRQPAMDEHTLLYPE